MYGNTNINMIQVSGQRKKAWQTKPHSTLFLSVRDGFIGVEKQ